LLIKILVVDTIPFRALISYCHQNQKRLLDPCKFCSGKYFFNLSFGCWLVKPLPLRVREAGFSFFFKKNKSNNKNSKNYIFLNLRIQMNL
jgi:hypothetical protein